MWRDHQAKEDVFLWLTSYPNSLLPMFKRAPALLHQRLQSPSPSRTFFRTMVATQDSTAPLAVIVGITGNQGGSVANHLVDSAKPYRIIGLTRDASKPSAQAFAQKGIKLHEVNIVPENEAAVAKAFEGADIVFVSISSI